MFAHLEDFLRHGLDQLFGSYPLAWIDLACQTYQSVRSDLIEDAAEHSPAWREETDFDAAFLNALVTDAPLQATLLYRISHALFLGDPGHPMLRYLAFFMRARTAMEIYYSAEIKPGFCIMHGAGTVIGPRHKIGPRFTVYQNVTLGQRRRDPNEFITIGAGCTIYTGAKVIGKINIGEHVKLAANAVLLSDAEAHSTYAGVPAVKVRSKKSL